MCWADRRHQSVWGVTQPGARTRREETSLDIIRRTGHCENQDTTKAYTFDNDSGDEHVLWHERCSGACVRQQWTRILLILITPLDTVSHNTSYLSDGSFLIYPTTQHSLSTVTISHLRILEGIVITVNIEGTRDFLIRNVSSKWYLWMNC